MRAILSFILVVSESSSKQGLPSSPQNRLHPHLSNTSRSASHKTSESHSCPMQTKAADTQLKLSPHGRKAIKHQACLQSASTKKSLRLSKEIKTGESSPVLGSSEVSVEQIMALFKPMLSCISPLPDLVRIQLCFVQMFCLISEEYTASPVFIYNKMFCCSLFIQHCTCTMHNFLM